MTGSAAMRREDPERSSEDPCYSRVVSITRSRAARTLPTPPRPRENVTKYDLSGFTGFLSDRICPCVIFRLDVAPMRPPAPSATFCWRVWRPTAASTCPRNTRPCRPPTWTSCGSSCARKATRRWPPASSRSSSTTSPPTTCARSRPVPIPPPPSPTRRSCPSTPWKAPTCTSPTYPTAPRPPSKTWRCSSSANSSNMSSPAAATGSLSWVPPPATPAPPPNTRCAAAPDFPSSCSPPPDA